MLRMMSFGNLIVGGFVYSVMFVMRLSIVCVLVSVGNIWVLCVFDFFCVELLFVEYMCMICIFYVCI